MTIVSILFQIGDLLRGSFTWRGLIQLSIFIVMGIVVLVISGLFIKVILKSRKNGK